MNDIMMSKLTDAKEYKHIADEVYQAACTNYYTRDEGKDIDRDLCLEFTKQALARKANLIALLSQHPQWDDKEKRIHLTTKETRAADPDEARHILYELGCLLANRSLGVAGYIGTDNATENCIKLTGLGHLLSSSWVRQQLVDNFGVTPELENRVKCELPDAHITAGTKCTKALIRLLRQYGVPEKKYPMETSPETGEISQRYYMLEDKWRAPIASAYTRFADAVNPLDIQRQTLISVNPADFLLMSRGNSWHSCHDIRSCGGWQAGCSSYAFDPQTIIMYTVYEDTPYEDITMTPKLNRQLVFWNGKVLFPCRIYPQDTDGNSNAYNQSRAIIEDVMATCLGVPNLWKKVGDCARDDYRFIDGGLQYKDYASSSYSFKTYSPSEFTLTDEDYVFEIGSDDAFCLACGEPLDMDGAIICSECANEPRQYCVCCGERLRDDEGTWIGEDLYCDYCRDDRFTYCESCDEWVDSDDIEYVTTLSRWTHHEQEELWCSWCRDHNAFYCDGSERWYDSRDFSAIDTEDGYTLEGSWAEENAYHCEECDEWYRFEGHIKYREDAEQWLCDDCYEAWLEENAENNETEEVAC